MEFEPRLVVDDEITLVRTSVSDTDELFRLIDANRKFLREWLVWVDSTTESSLTEKYLKSAESGPPSYKILYRGELCGMASYNIVSELHKFASIGYWLAEDFNGKGIMTRVCAELTRYALMDLDLNKVEISVNPGNKASAAIPERLGYKKEGTLRHRELLSSGEYGDIVTYGILKSEFRA